jgi:hypothetical protein
MPGPRSPRGTPRGGPAPRRPRASPAAGPRVRPEAGARVGGGSDAGRGCGTWSHARRQSAAARSARAASAAMAARGGRACAAERRSSLRARWEKGSSGSERKRAPAVQREMCLVRRRASAAARGRSARRLVARARRRVGARPEARRGGEEAEAAQQHRALQRRGGSRTRGARARGNLGGGARGVRGARRGWGEERAGAAEAPAPVCGTGAGSTQDAEGWRRAERGAFAPWRARR